MIYIWTNIKNNVSKMKKIYQKLKNMSNCYKTQIGNKILKDKLKYSQNKKMIFQTN